MSTQKLPEVFGDWVRVWGKGRICEVFCRKDAIVLAADIDGAYIGYDGHTMEITDEVYERLVRLLSRDSMAYEPPTVPHQYSGKELMPTGLHKVPPPEVAKAYERANREG